MHSQCFQHKILTIEQELIVTVEFFSHQQTLIITEHLLFSRTGLDAWEMRINMNPHLKEQPS